MVAVRVSQPQKLLHHPDLQVLAEVCEEAGADLRVVVIARRPAALVQQAVVRKSDSPQRKDLASVLQCEAGGPARRVGD